MIAIPLHDVIITSLPFVAPTAEPLGISGSSLTSESISLSWDPPPFDQQNGRIRQYLINITELDTGSSFLQTSSGTEFTVYSLHPNYYYEFTVAAVTVGVGPPSPPIVVQTNEDGNNIIQRVRSIHIIVLLSINFSYLVN